VLVATTVIEVGIDVAEANVVVVENAERFGLAQLHQIRGRVGRGTARSWCVLIVADDASAAARARLAVLVGTRDGFEIAERDLELRGPGEVLATDQHGPADLSFLALAVRRPEQVARIRELARTEVAALGMGARTAVAARVRSGWRERLRDGAGV
jgi:ATP-dependent DNA helicase RecG